MISIIMPIYNAENTLKRSVDSLINQTYKNIEIILVNDGSEDNSGEICLNYKKSDSRVKYVSQKNGGIAAARNHGLKIATGDYIAFLDADDYLDVSFCEKMLKRLISEDAGMCICRNYRVEQYIGSDGKINEKIVRPAMKNGDIPSVESEKYDFYSKDSHWTVWGILFKKEVLNGLKFRKGLYVGEDTYYLAKVIKNTNKIAFLNELLVYYIIAIESASNGKFDSRKYTEMESWQRIIHLYSDRPEQQNNIRATYAKRCLKLIKKYYSESEEFRKYYYKNTISEYCKNAGYAFREDIKNRKPSHLLKHLLAYIAPDIIFKPHYMFFK